MKKILIIDDEEDLCFFIKLNLQKTGKYKVLTAFTGTEGIGVAGNEKPDLILLDRVMPDMAGDEVKSILKNNGETKGIPVVFMTAMISPEMGDFIAKPVSISNLLEKLGSILGND